LLVKINPTCVVSLEVRITITCDSSETAQGSIVNTALIPRGTLEMKIDTHESIKQRHSTIDELVEQPIYLLYRTSTRSIFVALSLKKMGFKDMYSLEDGLLAWQVIGYKVITAS
jgi:rhodanese-related sulfurtransferase